MKPLFICLLFILGACFGSFLCCQARRLKLKQKSRCALRGIRLGQSGLGAATRRVRCDFCFSFSARSICLHCGYQLKWYDNIPIFSWLFLRGKCRKCHKKIGIAEFLSEILLALAWAALGFFFDFTSAISLEWAIFIVTLLLTLPLTFLAIYDGLYGELPTIILIISIIIAGILLGLKECFWFMTSGFSSELIVSSIGSVLILGGIYLFLYLISHGKWVGDGDWLLGTAIGLALGDAWLALIALFVANFSATLVALPMTGKQKNHQIHFGPFLVFAFVVALLFAHIELKF